MAGAADGANVHRAKPGSLRLSPYSGDGDPKAKRDRGFMHFRLRQGEACNLASHR